MHQIDAFCKCEVNYNLFAGSGLFHVPVYEASEVHGFGYPVFFAHFGEVRGLFA